MKVMKKALKATFTFALIGSAVYAQNINDAKKASDAEQYQKANGLLKSITMAQATNGEAYFHMGRIYLKTDYIDSAKMAFSKGVAADPTNSLNYIGLGAVDLQKNNLTSAKSNFDKAISLAKKKDDKPYLFVGKAYTQASKPDFKTALTYLEKAKSINDKDAEVYLALGDAHRGVMDNSSAYSDYRTSFDLDKTLLRSKLELGVINKLSKAYPESAEAFNSIIALDPNYGPAYRELAETYYLWANYEPKTYDEKIKQALKYYEKYIALTDKSLDSRMRHADFLILTKDYKSLEQEAQQMATIDKANPRIYRYLGYSAYENGNYPASVQALKGFMSKVDSTRLIAQDYMYLGRAQLKSGAAKEGISNLKKAIKLDSTNTTAMSEVGKSLYDAKSYADAAEAYEISIQNPKAALLDYYYLGLAHYFDYGSKETAKQNPSKTILVQADTAFSQLLTRTPTTEAGWQYRGRINRLLDDANDSKGLAVPYYEKYVNIVTVEKPDRAEKSKAGLIEAYTYLGSVAARRDKDNAKAKQYFNQVLALDPQNATAQQAIKAVSGGK